MITTFVTVCSLLCLFGEIRTKQIQFLPIRFHGGLQKLPKVSHTFQHMLETASLAKSQWEQMGLLWRPKPLERKLIRGNMEGEVLEGA